MWWIVGTVIWIVVGTFNFIFVAKLPKIMFEEIKDRRAAAIMLSIAAPIGIILILGLILFALLNEILKSDRLWKRIEKD